MIGRRRLLQAGCAHCALVAVGAGAAPVDESWTMPARFARPDLSSDEGGLWAMMDREETRLRRSAFVYRDAALREYLSGIACRLGGAHCADVRVYAVRTPWFNASMAPNGMLQVWSGLLLRMENEAQLAGVIGHEIGHYLQRHSVERLRDAKSRSAFGAVLASTLGLVGAITNLALVAGMYAYGRDHEREADRIGLKLMSETGYDPREVARVWANLRDEIAAGADGDPSKKSVLFASHPPSAEREQDLQRMAEGGSGFTGEAEYQARLEPFLHELCEDELKRGQYDESIVLFDRMVAKRPQRGDLRYWRAEARRARARGDDTAAARADLEAAIAMDKTPPQAHRALGLIHRDEGRRDAAAASFSRYLEAAPGAPDAPMIRTYLEALKS